LSAVCSSLCHPIISRPQLKNIHQS